MVQLLTRVCGVPNCKALPATFTGTGIFTKNWASTLQKSERGTSFVFYLRIALANASSLNSLRHNSFWSVRGTKGPKVVQMIGKCYGTGN